MMLSSTCGTTAGHVATGRGSELCSLLRSPSFKSEAASGKAPSVNCADNYDAPLLAASGSPS
jgi:hypothetical protein